MSLSLIPLEGRLSRADNAFPLRPGVMGARPGALQILDVDITDAIAWGERVVYVSGDSLYLYDGESHRISAAGALLDGTGFQALTENGRREDRFYIADGVNRLWFIAFRDERWIKVDVVNDVADPESIPYPVPVPSSVGTWRNRLWIGTGNNRVVHSNNEKPHELDPLNAIEMQGDKPTRVVSIEPFGDALVVGTSVGPWAISGTSPFNFSVTALVENVPVTSRRGAATDGQSFYWVSDDGVRSLGLAQPLTLEAFDEAFSTLDPSATLALSGDSRWLLFCVDCKVYCLLTATGEFGALAGSHLGVTSLGGKLCWYGPDGLWLLESQQLGEDWSLAGETLPIESVVARWPVFPADRDRALLRRVDVSFYALPGSRVSYSVESNERSVSDVSGSVPERRVLLDFWDGEVVFEPRVPVQSELYCMLPGTWFKDEFRALGAFEILSADYQFSGGE